MSTARRPARPPGTDGAVVKDPIVEVVKKADYETFRLALADDVIFRSPVSRFRFKGKDITSTLFERLVKQSDLDKWEVLDSGTLGDAHTVLLTTTVRGHKLDLILVTRFNERFQIREVTAYGRPLAAIAIFPAFVYPHLVERFRDKRRSAILRVLFRPLPRALEKLLGAGLGFGRPPQAMFEKNLPTSGEVQAPPPEPEGPRSPFRRV
jgi:hypothetical protein